MYFAEPEKKNVVYFRLQMLRLSELERSGLPLVQLMDLGFQAGGQGSRVGQSWKEHQNQFPGGPTGLLSFPFFFFPAGFALSALKV